MSWQRPRRIKGPAIAAVLGALLLGVVGCGGEEDEPAVTVVTTIGDSAAGDGSGGVVDRPVRAKSGEERESSEESTRLAQGKRAGAGTRDHGGSRSRMRANRLAALREQLVDEATGEDPDAARIDRLRDVIDAATNPAADGELQERRREERRQDDEPADTHREAQGERQARGNDR